MHSAMDKHTLVQQRGRRKTAEHERTEWPKSGLKLFRRPGRPGKKLDRKSENEPRHQTRKGGFACLQTAQQAMLCAGDQKLACEIAAKIET